MNSLKQPAIYIAAFTLGASLMAFEILTSRLLTPFFGSGIYKWASLISVVLIAMMVGYFAGGHLVDRMPTLKIAAVFASIAGAWFAVLPFFVDPLLEWVITLIEDEVAGVMFASALVQLIPITALGTFSPIAIRVSLTAVDRAGRTAALIYVLSTTGNVVGVLGAALYLIPNFPTTVSIYGLSVVCFATAAMLWAVATEPEEAAQGRPA